MNPTPREEIQGSPTTIRSIEVDWHTFHRPTREGADDQSLDVDRPTDHGRPSDEIPLISRSEEQNEQSPNIEANDSVDVADPANGIQQPQNGIGDAPRPPVDGNGDLPKPYTMQPIDPPNGHPEINYLPAVLAPASTITLMLVFLGVGVGTAILLKNAGSEGLYRSKNVNIYFVARYIPSAIGTITVLLFRLTVRELRRMTPYMAMADNRGRRCGADAKRSIASLSYPRPPLFRCSTVMETFAFISIAFASTLVSFKTALLSTQKSHNNDHWVIAVHKEAVWVLVFGYALMALFTFTATIWLWNRQTGLKWNPISLADKVALFRNSDVLSRFGELEQRPDARPDVLNENFRLGYWRVRRTGIAVSAEIWYGIGVVNCNNSDLPVGYDTSPIRQEESILQENGPTETTGAPSATHSPGPGQATPVTQGDNFANADVPPKDFCDCTTKNEKRRCRHYPYRHTPFIEHWFIVFWMVVVGLSFVLCLWLLASGKVKNGFSLNNTWYKYVPPKNTTWNENATVPSSFSNQTSHSGDIFDSKYSSDPLHDILLYAFAFRSLPTLIAGYFAVGFLSIVSVNHCYIQPFVGMHKEPGPASQTLLLDYLASSALEVPLKAWDNKHWKLAWFSVLSTISSIFPILVGGIFSITNTGKTVVFQFSVPAFAPMFTFLVVYCISLPFIWPTNERLLPRQYYSLADLMAFCYRSHFLWRPDFDISKPEITQQHLAAKIFLREDSYLFGVYKGWDGKLHLGFDAAIARGKATNLVVRIPPISQLELWTNILRDKWRQVWRYQRIESREEEVELGFMRSRRHG